MGEPGKCWGHGERESRKNQINKLLNSPLETLDDLRRVLIKKGPVSEETSLKELEEKYERKPEWKVIEEGGVLCIPVEEFRMIDLPRPDRADNIDFGRRQEGAGKKIEDYPPVQTVHNLDQQIVLKYNEEKEKAKASGKSESESERSALAMATKLPEFTAVQKWKDVDVEIKLKGALEKMMKARKIPALIIRSLKMDKISALKDLGINLDIPEGGGEIDLVMAYFSGDILDVVIFEVKRADTFPWKANEVPPNKQAVNKAEIQLTKDVKFLKSLMAGVPSSKIRIHTVACFPDTSKAKLQTIICSSCLERDVICLEDIEDLSLLQKKTQVPDKPEPATTSGKKKLLTFTARILNHLNLLHVGYRTEDKEKRASEKQTFNVEFADKKIEQNEFVVASPQQQQVIASFTASSTKRHLVLEGPAGTGQQPHPICH